MTDDTVPATGRPASVVLTEALALTSHYAAEVTMDIPTGPGWISYRELTSPAGLRMVADRAAELAEARTAVERSAATGLVAGRIASMIAFALTGALCVGDGALRISPDALAVRFGADGVEGLGVAEHGLELCQDAPDTVTAEAYAGLLTPMLAGLAPLVRRGRRALWVDAGDRLVSALFYNFLAAGRTDAAQRAETLLAAAPVGLRHRVTLMELPEGTWKRRAVCCLAHQTPASTGYCMTCPHLSVEDSACQVSAWLATR